MAAPLFTLPILPSGKLDAIPTGSILCTSPAPQVYLLTFTAPPDNRLLTPFCQTLLLALDIIEFSHAPGVVVTTSGIQKFYSNGLNLEHAVATPGFWSDSFYTLLRRFLTYPMPTVALINGHAFAGGLMMAMHHDYRIFNPSRGFLCLNELEFGAPLKPPMSSIFRQKLPQPSAYRSMVLEAKRFGGQEALDAGIVDVLGGLDEALALVKDKKLTEKGKTGVYGLLKAEMYRESIGYLEGHEESEERDRVNLEKLEKRKVVGQKRVKEWQKNATKSKL
ncbi:enoyl-CoA hydratase/isomerase [Phlyctema vagabunda]|uniref:Enoyl-CoA hydratase/isomerase n=1 Tax=Phlyctema vagabunda TaxID=108571 RepID=A0ABR4PDL7_9HELO